MKYIRQFRFYGDGNAKNYPANLDKDTLYYGNIFKDCGLVTQLGIQATPGTIFYLNSSIHPISVGSTGIYELNLEGLSSLSSIQFSETSLEAITGDSDGILIDIVYEGAGVNT